ncbi:AAA family ATPase [Candidatus Woesearchaeota archaeon]|nr:AAA family ATPase [Candidatus Woesearchaeota archaeon]
MISTTELLGKIKIKNPRTIGIDGNSGAGKTTFAKKLAEKLGGFYFPFDLFHREERKEWNLDTDINLFEDYAMAEIALKRLLRGESFHIDGLYNHSDGTFTRTYSFEPRYPIVVEGLTSMRLDLDFKIFLDIDPGIALIRGKDRDIRERNLTEEQWKIKKKLFHDDFSKIIPELKEKADIIIDTTDHYPEI